MRETRPSGSEGGARFNPSFLPLSVMDRSGVHVRQDVVTLHEPASLARLPLFGVG